MFKKPISPDTPRNCGPGMLGGRFRHRKKRKLYKRLPPNASYIKEWNPTVHTLGVHSDICNQGGAK